MLEYVRIQESTIESRNPLSNPGIHYRIQESTIESRNPRSNPGIHDQIQESMIESRNPLELINNSYKVNVY